MSETVPDLKIAEEISQSSIDNISRMIMREIEEFYTSPKGLDFFLILTEKTKHINNYFTKYSHYYDDNSRGGEKNIPLSFKEAIQWTESYLSYNKYVVAFGEPEE